METLFDAGLFLMCIGALVLVALVAFVFRALTRAGNAVTNAVTGKPDPADPSNPVDAEPYGSVPATGAREYDVERGTEVRHQDRVDEDVTLRDPGLDRDRPPYDRDAGDLDDDRDARRRDDDIL
jgi:hypothetical protein